jgi:hypothetical protein
VPTQQRTDTGSVLLYLSNHGHQIHSVDLTGGEDGTICIRQLPSNLRQLNSLQLKGFNLQFRPGINGFKGVLESIAATAALKQLRLSGCRMLDIGGSLKAWQVCPQSCPSNLTAWSTCNSSA